MWLILQISLFMLLVCRVNYFLLELVCRVLEIAASIWIQYISTFCSLSAGHVLRELIAGAFAPELAKKLSKYVQMEKNIMRSMDGVSNERMEVAVRFEASKITPAKTLIGTSRNNYQPGGRRAKMMSRTSQISLGSWFTRLATSKTNLSTAMINTV